MKTATIEIQVCTGWETVGGKQERIFQTEQVSATVFGTVAVNAPRSVNDGNTWMLTHVPTGLAVTALSDVSHEIALKVAQRLDSECQTEGLTTEEFQAALREWTKEVVIVHWPSLSTATTKLASIAMAYRVEEIAQSKDVLKFVSVTKSGWVWWRATRDEWMNALFQVVRTDGKWRWRHKEADPLVPAEGLASRTAAIRAGLLAEVPRIDAGEWAWR